MLSALAEWLPPLGMALHLLVLLGLYLAAGPAVRAGTRAWLAGERLPAPADLPPLALIVPLTGDTPGMRRSLASLLHQPGISFPAYFVVRDEADPAAGLVRSLMADHPGLRLVFSGPAQACCQKNHSLLAGIRAAGEGPEILVFCDSTHDAAPDFLARLTAPVAQGRALLSTTYHRILPSEHGLPALCHYFSALLVHLLQNLPPFRLPWGGATAIRRDAFFRHAVDAVWARGVVDDFTMGPYLQARGVRTAGVPEAALLTRLGRQSWGGWWGWWFRQLLYLKLCMPGTWLAATLAPLGGGLLLLWVLADMASGGLLGWAYLGGLGLVGVLLGGLCQEPLPLWRRAAGFLAMQALTVPCFLATWGTSTLRWRGIAYRARLDGTVRAVIRSDS